MLSDIFPLDQSQYSFVGFLELASVQNVHGGWRLLEDAAPHYYRHHHSASVPLCCLLPVSLTAVSQAPACIGKPLYH